MVVGSNGGGAKLNKSAWFLRGKIFGSNDFSKSRVVDSPHRELSNHTSLTPPQNLEREIEALYCPDPPSPRQHPKATRGPGGPKPKSHFGAKISIFWNGPKSSPKWFYMIG